MIGEDDDNDDVADGACDNQGLPSMTHIGVSSSYTPPATQTDLGGAGPSTFVPSYMTPYPPQFPAVAQVSSMYTLLTRPFGTLFSDPSAFTS